jgi:GTPase SAR1 family protein
MAFDLKRDREQDRLEKYIEHEVERGVHTFLRANKNELETFEQQKIKLKNQIAALEAQKIKLEQHIATLKESKDLGVVAKENFALKTEVATEPHMFCVIRTNASGHPQCLHVRAKHLDQVKVHAKGFYTQDVVKPFKFIDISDVPDDTENILWHKRHECCVNL